ncbi:MAG TPA: hypothetical protein VKK79_04105 [Candidatus Lokiarchaeia archaeon]|nr:hypothetical protein [Candidatus Lokiarchaeia archaeon]
MAFGKAFGAALGLYAALNFGLSLVVVAVGNPNGLVASLTLNNILLSIFEPAIYSPAAGFINIAGITSSSSNWMGPLFNALYLILPPILAGLIAGKLAEEPKSAFGAWFLVPILFAVVTLIVFDLVQGVQSQFNLNLLNFALTTLASQQLTYVAIYCILVGLVNGLMWSGLACAVTGP